MGKVHQEDSHSKENKTEFSLVRIKGTWKCKVGEKTNKKLGECISAAKM